MSVVCVFVCVLSSGSLHACVSSYLFFHQFNFQLFIHSKGYLAPCTCNMCNCPRVGPQPNQSRQEKLHFWHYLFFFFVRYHLDLKYLLWLDYNLIHKHMNESRGLLFCRKLICFLCVYLDQLVFGMRAKSNFVECYSYKRIFFRMNLCE